MKSSISFLIVLLSISGFAQSTVTPEDRKKANEAFTASKWTDAIALYKAIAEKEPQNWNARMRWGISLTSSNNPKDAVPVLEEAVKLNTNGQTLYALSSAYAGLKNADQAFVTFEKAVANGFSQLTSFEADAGFNSFKNDSRYEKAKGLLKRNVYPCLYNELNHQFDFWLGEWDVRNVAGQFAGSSKIERMLGECIIFENWTSAPPQSYSGKSINLYNNITNKWMQTWFDDKGAVVEFINGEFKDNKMIFITRPNPTQNNQVTRLTFYSLEPDHVRQQFETSTDGTNWATTIDLHYFRVKK
jgi:tetratricopeptide (TPR) repeat protein